MQVCTSGFDIAKQTFHVVQFDARGKEIGRKKLSRAKVLEYFAKQPAHMVGLEACAGSHWWARQLQALGHTVKLMTPKTVKAFLQGAKNDYNDARAIALAAMQPEVRAVRHKSVDEQTVQALHRLRELTVHQRTGLISSMRALAHEFGVVIGKGARVFRRELPEVVADAENDLPDVVRRALWEQYALLDTLDERVKEIEQQLAGVCEHSEAVALLREIPGIGALIASALWSTLGDGSHWRRGRDVSASLGLVPRQHSSGGHTRLLGISKCGDRYLRYLLINGARSVLCWARTLTRRGVELCPLRRWALQVCARRGFNKAVVAVANRLARVAWAVLSSGQRYDAQRVGAGATL